MTNLTRRMIQDRKQHGLAATTQEVYVRAAKLLTQHFDCSPDRLSEEAIREFFVPLIEAMFRAARSLSKKPPKRFHLNSEPRQSAVADGVDRVLGRNPNSRAR